MYNIPETTTHVWTPAYQRPIVGYVRRRAFYRLIKDVWESYSPISDSWHLSKNDEAWFKEETNLGYFVPINLFTSPDFTCKEEHV